MAASSSSPSLLPSASAQLEKESEFEKTALTLIQREAAHLASMMEMQEAERKRILQAQMEVEEQRALSEQQRKQKESELSQYHANLLADLQSTAQSQMLALQEQLIQTRREADEKEHRARQLQYQLEHQHQRALEQERLQRVEAAHTEAARERPCYGFSSPSRTGRV